MHKAHYLLTAAAAIAMLAAPSVLRAESEGLSVGAGAKLLVNGISATNVVGVKAWLDEHMALETGLGFSVGEGPDLLAVQTNFLYALARKFEGGGKPPVYFGTGIEYTHISGFDFNNVALRFPVGVTHLFDKAPIEIVLEVAPTLMLTEIVNFTLATGAIGAYYHF